MIFRRVEMGRKVASDGVEFILYHAVLVVVVNTLDHEARRG